MPEFNPNVIGGLEIGVLLATLLYGMGTVQTYLYYRNFPKDSRRMKTTIAVIWIAETGHSICISWGIYNMTITHYGAPPNLISIPHGFASAAAFGAIIHPLVQATFTYRIYQLSQNVYISVLCWSISVYILVCTLVFVGTSVTFASPLTIELMNKYEDKWGWLIFSLFTASAFVDVMIAGSCCYFLQVNRSRALKRTASIIDKLMKWTIETGLVTSITAIVVVICFATMRDNYAWLAVFISMTGLYPNSLLALLNGRLELANRERMALISQSTETGLTNAIRFAADTDVENPPKQTFVSEGQISNGIDQTKQPL